MDDQPRAPTSLVGLRRPRPHSYTPQACERCRVRKQRCVLGDEEENVCRNCIESGSNCVFAPRSEKSKRSKGDPSLTDGTEEDERASPTYQPPPPRPSSTSMTQSITIASQSSTPTSIPKGGQQSTHPTHPTPPLIPGLMSPSNMVYPPTHGGPGGQHAAPGSASTSTHSGMSQSLPSHGPPADFDWQFWLSTLAQQARASATTTTSTPQQQPVPPPIVPLQTPTPPSSSTRPVQPAAALRLATSPASGMESDEGSMEEAARGLAMISLEASAEPHYVGESSGSLWTTVIGKGMQLPQESFDMLRRHAAASRQQSQQPPVEKVPLSALRQSLQHPLPDDVANATLEAVFQHLHPRYPFMDWVAFDQIWLARNEILLAVGQERRLDREGRTAAFFILMVLAIGSQLGKERALPGLLRPQDYYELAAPYLNIIVTLHTLPNIQGLLLLAVYSLRDSKGPSVWYLSGVTMRLCIGMGLHRNAAGRALRTLSKYEIEMRKRVFWSCYILDRMIAMLLGRPPGISDDDIDVSLPEIYDAPQKPELVSMHQSSMASSVHYIKLKRIESRIQRAVYTLNRQGQSTDYWALLGLLDDWEATIPPEASSDTCWRFPCCHRDWFLLKGVEARLHLLRPLCTDDENTGHLFVSHLAASAARGCEIQKRIHLQGQPMSNASVHSTFICGLALLYAVFLQPNVIPLKEVFSGIKAASNTLFAYSQRTRMTEVLYDVFEELSAVCIDQMSNRDPKSKPIGPAERSAAVDQWQKVSSEATSNINPETASEYVNILQSLGITVGEERTEPTSVSEPLWELAAFSPGSLFPLLESNAPPGPPI